MIFMPGEKEKYLDKNNYNATPIQNLKGEKIKEGIQNKDYNAAAEALGHILSIALDFKVNL